MGSWSWTGFALSAIAAAAVFTNGCATHPPLPQYGLVTNFSLTDQTGAPFSSVQSLDHRVWIADFIYTTCPGPCPRMSSQMHDVQKALAGDSDLRLVSFTVDPAHDTPPVLTEYAKHFEAEPGKWFFLTGPLPEINRLDQKVFLLGDGGSALEHSTRFVLVDRNSRIRGYYASFEPNAISNLIADAKTLLKEKS